MIIAKPHAAPASVEAFPFAQILCHVKGPVARRGAFDKRDLFWTAVAAFVRCLPHLARLHGAPLPSAGNRSPLARAIEDVFLGASGDGRDEIRTVAVATERNQVTSGTLRALYAMSNPGHEVISLTDVVSKIQIQLVVGSGYLQCPLER